MMASSSINRHLDEAYAYCRQIAKKHYENFPVLNFGLSKNRKNYISAIYAFARTADDFADELNISREERRQKLAKIESQLQECYTGTPKTLLFIALQDTIKACKIPIEVFLDLLQAFKDDLIINRYENFPALFQYCRHSVNTIGRLVLLVYGIDDAKLMPYSDKVCTALQLTNFWQDVGIDLTKNRIYIPLEELRKFNLTEKDIENKIYNQNFRELMAHLINVTQQLFDAGQNILSIPNSRLRFFIKLVVFGSQEILQKIKKNNYDVYSKRIIITRYEKFNLLFKALFFRSF